MTISRYSLALVTLLATLCMLPVAPAAAGPIPAGGKTPLGGTVTITGTDGRDEVRVSTDGTNLVVSPALGLSSTQGVCPPDTDALTGRPVEYRCINGGQGGAIRINTLIVNLQGGNDSLEVVVGSMDAVTASGGAGNDQLVVIGPNRKLFGGDGDDVLVGPDFNSVAFDGGAGSDLVDFGASAFNDAPVGVTASLETGLATFRIPINGDPNGVFTETLTGIERLSGSVVGDVLTGTSGADQLLGVGGPDIIKGGDGADTISGGVGNDELTGGKGADNVDGGTGIDAFITDSAGGDTLNSRDGFLESVTCVNKDVLVADLVDKLLSQEKCLSVSIAQAKHRFDTRLSRRSLRVGADDALHVRVSCPRAKTERCVGRLRARLGGRRGPVLDSAGYRLRPRRKSTLLLELTTGEARRARGARITLQVDEVDDDGRPRQVLQRVRVR